MFFNDLQFGDAFDTFSFLQQEQAEEEEMQSRDKKDYPKIYHQVNETTKANKAKEESDYFSQMINTDHDPLKPFVDQIERDNNLFGKSSCEKSVEDQDFFNQNEDTKDPFI